MDARRLFKTSFASVYPLYVQKAERKGRTKQEVDTVLRWLTGYGASALAARIRRAVDFETFFREAPAPHPNAGLVTGVVCGVRVEDVQDPLLRTIRRLDKLVDELAQGRPLEKILRTEAAAEVARPKPTGRTAKAAGPARARGRRKGRPPGR